MTITVTRSDGTTKEGPGTAGTRVVNTDYPYEEGLTAGTTKQVGSANLGEE